MPVGIPAQPGNLRGTARFAQRPFIATLFYDHMSADKMKKWIWTDSDYDTMSWHDNYIHAMSFNAEESSFDLDIDYITEWVEPEEGEDCVSFWVAPATLHFRSVSELDVDIQITSVHDFSILEIAREKMPNTYRPDVPLYQFEISLDHIGSINLRRCSGFNMYIREPPKKGYGQCFTREERGGISLSKETPKS